MSLFRTEIGRTIAELTVGERASFTRTITKQDVLQYMSLAGDLNPLYVDTHWAGRTKWESPIVPANMLAGFAMGAVASALPGPGSLTLAHSYRLLKAPRVGDQITAEMAITEIRAPQNQVVLQYRQVDQTGQAVLEGELTVEPPEAPRPIVPHAYETF
ncbi:MAG TPA: MaoC family dehydratase N-terminal domain-containing protein [Symbiobacteriaceae bacterium]|nr:MaoC family dehydratase N-terminal domain-containing protein [Symbiobacteriaceae bacterium]